MKKRRGKRRRQKPKSPSPSAAGQNRALDSKEKLISGQNRALDSKDKIISGQNQAPDSVRVSIPACNQQAVLAMKTPVLVEGSVVSAVMEHFKLVLCIVNFLSSPEDRLSASLVCHMWNEAVVCGTQQIAARSRSMLSQLHRRFSHVRSLNLGPFCDELQNQDLSVIASFSRLEILTIGHLDNPQEQELNKGFVSVARNCPKLRNLSLCFLLNLSNTAISHLVTGRYLHSVLLEDCPCLTDSALNTLSASGLQELTLKGEFSFTSQGLAVIGRCYTLLSIRLEHLGIEVGVALKSIARNCKKIQEISLKVKHVDLEDLFECTSLVCLRVYTEQYLSLDGPVMKIASANKGLQELAIVSPLSPPSDAMVVGLVQNCPELEKLHIHAANISGMALDCLMGCRSLKFLALDHYGRSGKGPAEAGLWRLDLQNLCLRFGSGIGDTELQTLAKQIHNLEVLDLQSCHGLSSIGFSSIAHCHNLQSLDLSCTQIDNISLGLIAQEVKCLKRLSLVKCEMLSDMCVIALFSALEALNLNLCPFVCDEGLDIVASNCAQLAHLSIASTNVTDVGLFCLTSCRSLRSLTMPRCWNVKGPGLVALAKDCLWLRHVAISDHFRGSKVAVKFKNQGCLVHFEVDDNLALVPFGLFL